MGQIKAYNDLYSVLGQWLKPLTTYGIQNTNGKTKPEHMQFKDILESDLSKQSTDHITM